MPEPGPKSDLAPAVTTCALAFRGYNVVNLGRTPELLETPAYRGILTDHLSQASALCGEVLGKPVDLVRRVAQRREADLADYAESVALVFATELAQVDLLREVHGVDVTDARLAIGYSLGELVAVAVSGVADPMELLGVPLRFANDCAELAHGVTMGVVFSRGAALDEAVVARLCEEITAEGRGTIAISAVLSPNTLLVLGQGETLDRLKDQIKEAFAFPTHVRRNDALWPPLHTPIVRQKNVCDRASQLIERLRPWSDAPSPPLLSLVTGRPAYTRGDCRSVLRDWIDHPQRLWDGVCGVLTSDVRTVLHIGPAPNLIPATFRRLSDNVLQQTGQWSLGGFGLRAVQQLASRPWLATLLPQEGCLLRAPQLRHVVIEDWLLENAPG